MKKTGLLVTLCLLLLCLSCKKENRSAVPENLQGTGVSNSATNEGNYIADCYGVNQVHSFVFKNPDDENTSLELFIKWDENGVAHYGTHTIPRDETREKQSNVFLPESEINKADGHVSPTNLEVKTVTLIYDNGNITPLFHVPNGPRYCWMCGPAPACWVQTGPNQGHWACFGTPGNPSPYTPKLVLCGSGGSLEEIDILTYQTN
jgi:hypothetical protein